MRGGRNVAAWSLSGGGPRAEAMADAAPSTTGGIKLRETEPISAHLGVPDIAPFELAEPPQGFS